MSRGAQDELNKIYLTMQKNTAALTALTPKKGLIKMTDFSLDQLLAAVQAQTTAVANLQAAIKAVPGLTAAQQTEVDTIFAGVQANTDAINAAIAANTPPPPGP